MQMDVSSTSAPSASVQDIKQGSLTTLTSTKRNLLASNNLSQFNIASHLENQEQRIQYQPVQNSNQSLVVVSSDQIGQLHQSTPQFSGILPFDGGGARVVNIVSNDNMPLVVGNIGHQQRGHSLAPTLATPMQGTAPG